MKTIIKISAFLFMCILSVGLLLACATRVNAPEDTTPTTSSTPSTTVHTSLNTTPTTSTVPETTAPKTMYYSVTEEERLLIAQLVYREANTESLECQKAIVSVLFNRLACGKWGDTIEEVIYYKNAFTPATAGLLEGVNPTKTNYEAVDFVLENGPTLPTYVRYFRAGYHHKWSGYEGYTAIDHTYFGYFTDWQKGAW
jgi:spore germination cell wall hydrolase CwlJ-like protein